MTAYAKTPLFVVGTTRAGTTILHNLLLKACPTAIELTDDDFECRTFWQAFGLRIGSRVTGTCCQAATAADVTAKRRAGIQNYVAQRSGRNRCVVNKNPHLSNKIGFVADVLPGCRFVHIIRDPMGVVASYKTVFHSDLAGTDDHPSFVQYWPDAELPCWHVLRNDLAGITINGDSVRRVAKEACYRLGLRHRPAYTAPHRIFPHDLLSDFREHHPDASRYYPGDGFARLPEAWLTINRNILRQLDELDQQRVLTVSYSQLVSDPHATIGRILDFGDLECNQNVLPEHLNRKPLGKWKTVLTPDEQQVACECLDGRQEDCHELSNRAGVDLLADCPARSPTQVAGV